MDNKTLAKQIVKLINHVPGRKIKKGDSHFINPCPICGHNDHFVINESKNLYMSYSKCCNGGSIIDWFVEYEKLSLYESIKKCISFAGLDDKKISHNQFYKIKANNLKLNNKAIKNQHVIRECYHKLTRMERALRRIKDKSVFLNWLLSFLENYTLMFVTAKDENEMYKLCLDFKQELHYSYSNFCSYEKDLIEIVGKTDELKLLSGGIR